MIGRGAAPVSLSGSGAILAGMGEASISTVIVDRIENGVAVLEGEDGSLDVPASWLPPGAREGTVLRVEVDRDDGASRVVFTLDPEAQAAREAEIGRLRDTIPEGPDGDIAL